MNFIQKDTVLNNRYIIRECVGVGGMAVVYRGYDCVNDIDVAIKALKPEFAVDEQNISRFKKEAESAYRLNHPNIVKIFGIGCCSGVHYIAMQFIDGITLTEYMEKCGVFSWRNAFEIVAQILSALSFAHDAGVIHRDIKPQNILVDEYMHVTLTDFGIAQDTITANTINANTSACSVHYLSPEQARGSLVDGRSDIYSLGITLYEMLVGTVPFDGESTVAVALKHLQGKIVPPCEVDANIPRGVSDVVMMATMRDMGKRFQSADEMLAQMRLVSENENLSFWNPPVDRVFATAAENKVIEGAEPIRIPYLEEDAENFDDDVKSYTGSGTAAVVASNVNECELVVDGDTFFDDEAGQELSVSAQTSEGVDDDAVPSVLSADDSNAEADASDADDVLDEAAVMKARRLRLTGKIITYTVASLLAIAVAVGFISFYKDATEKNSFYNTKYSISNYEGHEATAVVAAFEAVGINVELKTVVTDKYPVGYIVSQDKTSDIKLSAGDTIVFQISAEEDSVVIENFIGQGYRSTRQSLENAGLVVAFEEVPGKNVNEGEVLRVVPSAGSIVSKGETVTVYIASGVVCEEVVVPDLVGNGYVTLSQAISKLQELNLNVGYIFPNPGENIAELLVTPTPDVQNTEIPSETNPLLNVQTATPTADVSYTFEPDDSLKDSAETATPDTSGDDISVSTDENGADTSETPLALDTEEPTDDISETSAADITASPTATPAPTAEPTATPLPTIAPFYASQYVVAQFPEAGTVLYEGDTVNLYFYYPSMLRMYESKTTEVLSVPEDMFENNYIRLIKIDFVFADGNTDSKSLSNIPAEDFPLEFEVPFSYGSSVTEVYIYVNDLNSVYEKRIVRK